MLKLLAVLLAAPFHAAAVQQLVQPTPFQAEPFPLSAVTLLPGSRLAAQRDANTAWLLQLDPTRLSCLYTSAANLTCSTTGMPYKCNPSATQPACTPYKGPTYYGAHPCTATLYTVLLLAPTIYHVLHPATT